MQNNILVNFMGTNFFNFLLLNKNFKIHYHSFDNIIWFCYISKLILASMILKFCIIWNIIILSLEYFFKL